MIITIIHSGDDVSKQADPFSPPRNNLYAKRFVANIKSHFPTDIGEAIEVPAALPYYIDSADDHLPAKLKPHDVMIAINIHEELLLELPARCRAAGGRAIIIPREDPEWVTPWAIQTVQDKCASLSLECVFPKPFCSLDIEDDHPVINSFIDHFRIGRPVMEFETDDNVVTKMKVVRSAPCGDTYYVAKHIRGKKVDEKFDWWISKFWGSYPCIASMKIDDEIGDALSHEAGYILLKAVHEALERITRTSGNGQGD